MDDQVTSGHAAELRPDGNALPVGIDGDPRSRPRLLTFVEVQLSSLRREGRGRIELGLRARRAQGGSNDLIVIGRRFGAGRVRTRRRPALLLEDRRGGVAGPGVQVHVGPRTIGVVAGHGTAVHGLEPGRPTARGVGRVDAALRGATQGPQPERIARRVQVERRPRIRAEEDVRVGEKLGARLVRSVDPARLAPTEHDGAGPHRRGHAVRGAVRPVGGVVRRPQVGPARGARVSLGGVHRLPPGRAVDVPVLLGGQTREPVARLVGGDRAAGLVEEAPVDSRSRGCARAPRSVPLATARTVRGLGPPIRRSTRCRRRCPRRRPLAGRG